MMKIYDHKKIEKKWREKWAEVGLSETDESSGKKSYVLGMFPYPSGEGLHTGHVRIYTAADVLARYLRMKGDKVLFPTGWDGFGLPAENAAIAAAKNPMDMVPKNEANFKRQMEMMGLSYDWDRVFSTTNPEYYRWTQWLFLKLYSVKNKRGERLVYRQKVPINWCPFCKTGLANEEVLKNGTHERCGRQVTQKLLPQWMMRITDYADRLLEDLDPPSPEASEGRGGLDWPKGILAMQENWIGRKEGVEVDHKVKDTNLILTAFSAYPGWLYADTFLVIAPEHPMVARLVKGTQHEKQVAKFVSDVKKLSHEERETDKLTKKGIFTGRCVVDPFTGEDMPVWLANFALMDFGTGIIRCSAHDPRDYEFAQKYGLKLREVVEREGDVPVNAHTNRGVLKNSGEFNGLKVEEAIEPIRDFIVKKGFGRKTVTYHLRDWVFSRQRYWGEPFPLVYCDKCGDENGVVMVQENQLPVELPYLKSYEPTDTGESPLSRVKDWVETKCPECGGSAQRETDTMPNWAGSCWYFLYFAKQNTKAKGVGHSAKGMPMSEVWEREFKPAFKKWLPVNWYLGGAEHAVLHLLYARFWVKAFHDLKLVDFEEPFLRLRGVGMVLAEDGRKMSKSLGNIVNPDEMVEKFGADSVRIYELFMGPWDQAIAWETKSLVGCYRFLERVWRRAVENIESKTQKSDPSLARKLNRLMAKVGDDVVAIKFNTAVAAWMGFANAWVRSKRGLSMTDLEKLVLVLAPIAPYMAEELFQRLRDQGFHLTSSGQAEIRGQDFKKEDSVHLQPWPEWDEKMLEEDEVTVVVQINGRLRATIQVKSQKSKVKSEVIEVARADERVAKWLEGKTIKNEVFVPGKLVNLVI